MGEDREAAHMRCSSQRHLWKEAQGSWGKVQVHFFYCVQMHLQTRFAFNAAELQRLYVLCGLKKSPKVNMRQFCERMQVLNDVIEWLPMKYYSPQSTENTVKCKKFADADMVS